MGGSRQPSRRPLIRGTNPQGGRHGSTVPGYLPVRDPDSGCKEPPGHHPPDEASQIQGGSPGSLFRGLSDRLPGERVEVRPGNGLGRRVGCHGRDHGAGRTSRPVGGGRVQPSTVGPAQTPQLALRGEQSGTPGEPLRQDVLLRRPRRRRRPSPLQSRGGLCDLPGARGDVWTADLSRLPLPRAVSPVQAARGPAHAGLLSQRRRQSAELSQLHHLGFDHHSGCGGQQLFCGQRQQRHPPPCLAELRGGCRGKGGQPGPTPPPGGPDQPHRH